jgi:opacity protein-like surface antigen
MKRLIWFLPAMLMLCVSNVKAQETPQLEFSGGYSYLDANLNGTKFHLMGGGVSATENLNSWFGGRVEFNAYTGNDAGTAVSAQTITYGPVFSFRRINRITPFAHIQVGVQHGSVGYLGISQSAFKFAVAPGGGLDLALTRKVVLRLDAEYLVTRFLQLTQENVTGSVGIVFRFGKK